MVMLSRSVNPVATPVMWSLLREASWIMLNTFMEMSSMPVRSDDVPTLSRSNILFSVSASISSVRSLSS